MTQIISNLHAVKSRGKLSERVQSQLEDLILSGKLKVNDQFPPETDLAKSFGVSRTVVREAIHRLEAQGLVRAQVGSGTRVVPFEKDQIKSAMARFIALNPSPEGFLDMLDLRRVLETETARRMAQVHDSKAIVRLSATLDRMRAHQNDPAAFAQADLDFHLTIAQTNDNTYFAMILEPLKKLGAPYRMWTYTTPEWIDRTYGEHARVFEAIANGNVDAAGEAMRQHIESSREHYRARWEAEEKKNLAGF